MNQYKVRFIAILLASILSYSAQAQLIINEVDYDQAGTDTAEFIELKNIKNTELSLDDFSVVLVNGNTGSAYRTIELPDEGLDSEAYFVLCGNDTLVANCDLVVFPATDLIQNGAPDAMAVFEGDMLVDVLSYEGTMDAPFVEGTGNTAEDDPDIAELGLSRFPDGADSNDNSIDFSLRCNTPGTANSAQQGDCDTPLMELLFSDNFEIDELPLPNTAGSFDTAKTWLYDRVHFDLQTTLYCGCTYNDARQIDLDSCGLSEFAGNVRADRVEAEHIFAASAFGNFRTCWREPEMVCGAGETSGRDCCLDTDPLFKAAHNDLMNLVPANGYINGQRSDLNWGMVEGEERVFGSCDFEIDRTIRRAEPAESARGDVARAMLYMRDTYGFRLSDQDQQLFSAWNNSDPPDSTEIQRHERIKAIQGIANTYIENYEQLTARQLEARFNAAKQQHGRMWKKTQAKRRFIP